MIVAMKIGFALGCLDFNGNVPFLLQNEVNFNTKSTLENPIASMSFLSYSLIWGRDGKYPRRSCGEQDTITFQFPENKVHFHGNQHSQTQPHGLRMSLNKKKISFW